MKYLIMTLLLLTAAAAVSEDSIEAGKLIVSQQTSCEGLADEELVTVGEYIVERRHPGVAHSAMLDVMGLQEGTAEYDVFHRHVALRWYCDVRPYRTGWRFCLHPQRFYTAYP